MAHRMRGTHQRHQTATWTEALRYKGFVGMNRWVGLGVIADNVINIARAMRKQVAP